MPRLRAGTTIIEVAVSVVVLSAAIALSAQIVAVVAQQRRIAERSTVAALCVANVMEDIMAWPWDEVTAERAAAYVLAQAEAGSPTDEALRQLPAGKLAVRVVAAEDAPLEKRIDVVLDWQHDGGQRHQGVRLTAWRYHTGEANP